MHDRAGLHRYELIPERRADERRRFERRTGDRPASDRRESDRRRGASLADAVAVRRVFPIAEGATSGRTARRELLQRRVLVLSDAFLAVAVTAAVVSLAGTGGVGAAAAVSTAAFTLVAAKLLGLYDGDELVLRRSTLDEVPRVAELAGLIAISHWMAFATGLGKADLLVLWGALACALVTGRGLARMAVRETQAPERCLVIGDAEATDHVRRKVEVSRANADVVAALRLAPGQTAEALGGLEGLRTVVRSDEIERVILAPTSTDAADTLELVRICKLLGVRVSILPRLFEVVGSAVEFENLDGMTMLGVRRFGLSATSRATKRAFDLVASVLGVIAISPVLGVVALAIRLDSKGPILFRQTRVGRDGEHFEIFKFRTMVADAERRKQELLHLNEAGDGMFKLAADPRITRVGRLLRKTSLDELPQLLNVVRGEMSLVGPRPLVLDEDMLILGLDRGRLHLTPGMTGPWQVLGSARVPMQEMVGIDYLYVANWSLWADLKLLVRTVSHVFSRGGM